MWTCTRCQRHVLPVVSVCPFCTTQRVVALSAAVATPMVLSACYGGPCIGGEWVDEDGDGYFANKECPFDSDDCDDTDPAVNPGAEEICDDGIDNDCDGVSAMSTNEEICNGVDDDCDGEIDEDDVCGSTTSTTGDTGSTSTTGDTATSAR
ncbi:MAG: putative metal-binding motif-containing protein [Myxococcales bacterium]|nr:putative metal-binding motif-containing protein [Myxococcales bacterium]